MRLSGCNSSSTTSSRVAAALVSKLHHPTKSPTLPPHHRCEFTSPLEAACIWNFAKKFVWYPAVGKCGVRRYEVEELHNILKGIRIIIYGASHARYFYIWTKATLEGRSAEAEQPNE